MASINAIFDQVQEDIETRSEVLNKIKEHVQQVEFAYRRCSQEVVSAHSTKISGFEALSEHMLAPAGVLGQLKQALGEMNAYMGQFPFYKYNFLKSHVTQNSIFYILFARWIRDHRTLSTPAEVAEVLGMRLEDSSDPNARFDFTYEDYLHALISLVNELSRLAVNSVTSTASANAAGASEPYTLPVEIDRFLKQVQSAFLSLNLKNDSLRRRSDSIKYDAKKVEEVVYDLALRGLISQ
ncbi:hypothetical protein TRICI_000832 [Trichomonascus ciferrii]|uniref:t-SNARE coiled-coil homology domain-containing protein n=1 Tax=Trichomonascus ciferrii TaxID=44093 RepID=A0A642VBW9_9ASCO|nr:hypothetical protein TRICI_000832 [Trichomonascus ciferrii]